MASTAITDEDRQRIHVLAGQGLTSREIARQLELPGRSVGGYITHLRISGTLPGVTPSNPGVPQGGTAGEQTQVGVVSEVAAVMKDAVQLGRETAAPPPNAGDPVDTATKAIKTGIDLAKDNGNGNGQVKDNSELLQFLTTITAQQDKSSQAIINQLNTQHNQALERAQKDHDLKMIEVEKKQEAEKDKERLYWERIETARKEADKERGELEKERSKMIAEKLQEVGEHATESMKHANDLISSREDSSQRFIDMAERHSGEISELRKEIGKGDGTQELIKHAIDKLGEPIVKAIEGVQGNKPAAVALGGKKIQEDKAVGNGLGEILGGKVVEKVKQAVLEQLKPYILEAVGQAKKHIERWPEIGMNLMVDLLWSWRMQASLAAYVQTAITYILLNDLDELVKKAGDFLSVEVKNLTSTPKAKKWWKALQQAVNERLKIEEAQTAAYKEQAQA